MNDLLTPPSPQQPPEPWSVSALAAAIRRTVEGQFGEVRIRGELGRVTPHASGHIYFDLKDANAVIHAAWFKGAQRKGSAPIEQGMEVIATGRLSTYPARSEYQLIVTAVAPAGAGALLRLIEERRKKLLAEGLFDEQRKKALPYLPRTIGIITSPTGAVIRDIMHRLRDRWLPHVLVWPVVVQGEAAAAQVREALEGFNRLPSDGPLKRPDVIIIARGGGSVEDLMPFNDEAMVRAVAASAIPVISAVGHETDTTLIDFAADRRAPTPTAAAEMAVPVRTELVATVADLHHRLQAAPARLIRQARRTLPEISPPRTFLHLLMQRLDDSSGRLGHGLRSWLHVRQVSLARLLPRPPHALVIRQRERLTALEQRLSGQAALRALQAPRQRVQLLGEKLAVLSYRSTLARGFAVVRDGQQQVITSSATTARDLHIEFADGMIRANRT